MPPRFGFLSAEGRAKTINLAECRCGCLAVQLPGLCKECFVVEVFHFEQRRGALASGGCQHRRVAKGEAIVVKEVSRGLDDLVPDFENGTLTRRTDPQVPMIH